MPYRSGVRLIAYGCLKAERDGEGWKRPERGRTPILTVLTLVCGTFGNVIRLLPPLVIPMDLLDEAVEVLETAVAAIQ